MGDRCTGHCCEEFTLGFGTTVEQIRDKLINANMEDGAYIANMIIPLRPIVAGTVMPNGRVVTEDEARHFSDGCDGWIFTCRHFDHVARNCTAYESRPRMCSEFPYGKPCEHGANCEWDKGRSGEHGRRFPHCAPLMLHDETHGRCNCGNHTHLRMWREPITLDMSAQETHAS